MAFGYAARPDVASSSTNDARAEAEIRVMLEAVARCKIESKVIT